MSAPIAQGHQVENMEYGFLAARALEAINRRIAGSSLTASDEEALQLAKGFLDDVIQGASLVRGADFHGHAGQVVTALRFASRPITTLRTAISNNEEFEQFFVDLSKTLEDPEPDTGSLQQAGEFFSQMFACLTDAIRKNESPLVGGSGFGRTTHVLGV